MYFSSIAGTIFSLPNTVTTIRIMRYFTARAVFIKYRQLSGKTEAIVKEMRSSGTTYTVFGLPSMITTIIREIPSFTARAVAGLSDKIYTSIYKMWSSGTASTVHLRKTGKKCTISTAFDSPHVKCLKETQKK